ncbi:Gp49 family protein [Xanthomonas campestris]|uniref:Gp49 family protein n=1 Tax=Xanthomonas campestris TaxID=339 RepID=UPI0005AF115F|nr:Gp49 family protein [Xanthomonas campestris]KIQ21553.1 phage family protein [Xanthomonas campestris]
MNDRSIEQEIQAKGLTAPRVTPADIEAYISGEFYYHLGQTEPYRSSAENPFTERQFQAISCLTICVIVLRNGFTVTGESACASPENFDAELGRKIARQNAVAKIWPLLGFRLRDKLAAE